MGGLNSCPLFFSGFIGFDERGIDFKQGIELRLTVGENKGIDLIADKFDEDD